jgi:hypothetical protein
VQGAHLILVCSRHCVVSHCHQRDLLRAMRSECPLGRFRSHQRRRIEIIGALCRNDALCSGTRPLGNRLVTEIDLGDLKWRVAEVESWRWPPTSPMHTCTKPLSRSDRASSTEPTVMIRDAPLPKATAPVACFRTVKQTTDAYLHVTAHGAFGHHIAGGTGASLLLHRSMGRPAMTAGLRIFDCDGVLTDSEIIACRTDASCLAEVGVAIAAEGILERNVGISAKAMFVVERVRPMPQIGTSATLTLAALPRVTAHGTRAPRAALAEKPAEPEGF